MKLPSVVRLPILFLGRVKMSFFFFSLKADIASDMLEKILNQAYPDDIMGEYIFFLKNLPKLLNNVESDLIQEVKAELGIGKLKLCGKVNFKGSDYPILDALSCKMGKSLRHILAPPTTSCLLCGKDLIANHKSSQVPLHCQWSWDCFQVRMGVPRLSRSGQVSIRSTCPRLFQYSQCIFSALKYSVDIAKECKLSPEPFNIKMDLFSLKMSKKEMKNCVIPPPYFFIKIGFCFGMASLFKFLRSKHVKHAKHRH